MATGGVAVLGVLVAGLLSLAVLTALGSRQRGGRWPLAVVSAAFFPVTWVAWYVRDGGRSRRRTEHATSATSLREAGARLQR